MKPRFILLTMQLVATPALAQERAAGSTLETQMTWSTLQSKISTVDSKVDGLTTRVEQMTVCGNKGKLYGPDAPGKDSQGCVDAGGVAAPPANCRQDVKYTSGCNRAPNCPTGYTSVELVDSGSCMSGENTVYRRTCTAVICN